MTWFDSHMAEELAHICHDTCVYLYMHTQVNKCKHKQSAHKLAQMALSYTCFVFAGPPPHPYSSSLCPLLLVSILSLRKLLSTPCTSCPLFPFSWQVLFIGELLTLVSLADIPSLADVQILVVSYLKLYTQMLDHKGTKAV